MTGMSGRRAKATQRVNGAISLQQINAKFAERTAIAVLGVKLEEVPLTRVNQFAVGWMRAALEQSKLIANLTLRGQGHVAAPNRRIFWELALRLLWLSGISETDRPVAVDSMLEFTRSTEATTDRHMREMGIESSIDLTALEEVVITGCDDPKIREQARNFTAAVRATKVNSGYIYRLWREDSTWAHATGPLAGSYATNGRGYVDLGKPPTVDENLESHRAVVMLIVFCTSHLIKCDDAKEDAAQALLVALLGVK